MPLRDFLHKRDTGQPDTANAPKTGTGDAHVTIMRSDTLGEELICAPLSTAELTAQQKRRSRFRSISGASHSSKDKSDKRLSSIFGLRSSSHERRGHISGDLPNIETSGVGKEEKEALWEKRATLLARESAKVELAGHERRPSISRHISDAQGDDDIQNAIQLHEQGDLARSTAMFGRLADPFGANNALSQVLYGLALRHGWGIDVNESQAITYLSQAASNSAAVETQALESGSNGGGAAKGELVLAIFELANCYRNGWGVDKDPIAARKYYETCANLGDIDSMLEAGRCYEDGFGGKKDKYAAAKYYRLAEQNGHSGVGNSWIWKDKYNSASR